MSTKILPQDNSVYNWKEKFPNHLYTNCWLDRITS